MEFPIVLAELDTKSSNEDSLFPRAVIEEYLGSERCKKRLDDKLMLGCITHKLRYGHEETEGLGADDRLLDEGVITHTIVKLWIEGNLLMAMVELFDDESDYSPEQLGKIKQLKKLFKHKVRVPDSIVVDADWDKDEKMTYLYDIIGVDFTLNPAFTNAKPTEIPLMS